MSNWEYFTSQFRSNIKINTILTFQNGNFKILFILPNMEERLHFFVCKLACSIANSMNLTLHIVGRLDFETSEFIR